MSELILRNRQRVRRVNLAKLRQLTRLLLEELVGAQNYELGIHLVAAPEMRRINQAFLRHEGSADVITFDYANKARPASSRQSHLQFGAGFPKPVYGEIFICVNEAVVQAREFKTRWPSEVVRYVIHGVLHLQGYDDLRPAARRKMKREEGRLLREIARRFALSKLIARPRFAT